MATIVSQRYAQSLYEIAVDEKISEVILHQMMSIKQNFEENPDFVKLLYTPSVSFDEKKELIGKIYKDKISSYLYNFLLLITEKGRARAFSEMADHFKHLYYEDNGLKDVTAITAFKMSEDMEKKLLDKLCEVTGKKVVLTTVIDESIIGGVVIKIGNEQIDTSVKTRLGELVQQMTQIIA